MGSGGWRRSRRLIVGSCSGSCEGDRTWAREVPSFQKKGVESLGHGDKLAVGVREREVSRETCRFLA